MNNLRNSHLKFAPILCAALASFGCAMDYSSDSNPAAEEKGAHEETAVIDQALTATFDTALWRIVAEAIPNNTASLRTLTRNTDGTLASALYSGGTKQQWRFRSKSANYEMALESTGQCLGSNVSNQTVALGSCGTSSAQWNITILRSRTEDRPALYAVHPAANTNLCLSLNNPTRPALASCGPTSHLYVEPVGYGERHYANQYSIKSLLITKPETHVANPYTNAVIASNVISGAQTSFASHMPVWYDKMTDGRVSWQGDTVVSPTPLTSLYYEGGNYLPNAPNVPDDVKRFLPLGKYDTAVVFFKSSDLPSNDPGYVPGGWGWGPGISPASNYTMWCTVNGGDTDAASWTSWDHEPTEVFIHEPMHGLDGFFSKLGVPLPDGWLHGAEQNFYTREADGYKPWYRDYLLGTVIAADGTYRGYGPRAFRKGTPRDSALSTFGSESVYRWGNSATNVFTGDFNGDGYSDIGVTGTDTQTDRNWYIRYNDKHGGFGNETVYPWGNTSTNVFTGDFNGDGYSDIGVTSTANQAGRDWFIRYNNKHGGFGNETVYRWGNSATNVFSGDFNGDGYWDIGVTGTATQNDRNWYIRYNDKHGGFGSETVYAWGNTSTNIFTGDFNGDGYWDIGVTSTASQAGRDWFIRFGNGRGSFGGQVVYPWGNSATNVFTGRFDGNQFWDIGVTSTATEAGRDWFIRYK